MDGIKRSDLVALSPIAPAPGSPGQGVAGKVGPGTAVSPRVLLDAPDPASVAAGAPASGSAPVTARQLELRGLVRDMAAAPPVDLGRVQVLKARIAAGSFAIDPARVADAMLGSLRAA